MKKEEFMLPTSPLRQFLCKLGIHTSWGRKYTDFGGRISIPYERFCRFCGHEEDDPVMFER